MKCRWATRSIKLQRKLPKLVKTDVNARLLLLERNQAWVDADTICDEVERLRPRFRDLMTVHEIWIVDTAAFDDEKDYVELSRREGGSAVESFAFFRGKLLSIAKYGMPVRDGLVRVALVKRAHVIQTSSADRMWVTHGSLEQ